GVGDVDVGPYELDALQDLLADAPERALLGALEGLRLLDVVPASDALEQRAARVGGAGAAAGEHVVEVEVRVDVGRDHQAAAEVDDLGGVGQARADLLDDAALDEDLAEPVVLAVDAGVDELPAGGLGPGSVGPFLDGTASAFGLARDAAEAEVRGGHRGLLGAARGGAVTEAVVRSAEVRTALHHVMRLAQGLGVDVVEHRTGCGLVRSRVGGAVPARPGVEA